ncbi:hypothetical protein FF011L_01810 [Roseimaritima multifibrata]|uniref:Nickel uptake substrate-specific transmembrane region n=1 Tax=Roseimaritima multifibrata TaxID=1930274 RepID=A0A517M9F1_9BACT|nr:hypothetical protein FF011L_01810 [Roseimaritima multifibrata]
MRFRSSILFALLLCCSTLCGQSPLATDITLTGKVWMANGEPAVGATILCDDYSPEPVRVLTDENGDFLLRVEGHWDTQISAASNDLRQQAALRISSADLRSVQNEPIRIQLRDARPIQLEIRKNGEPVAAARIGIQNRPLSLTKTDSDGNATAWVPADEKVDRIWVFHPQEGVAAWEPGQSDHQLQDGVPLQLSMHSANPHLIRMRDQFRDPVEGVTGMLPKT